MVNENKSRYLSEVDKIKKATAKLEASKNSIIGAAGGDEIKKMVLGAIAAAKDLVDFSYSLAKDCEKIPSYRLSSDELTSAIQQLAVSFGGLQIFESNDVDLDFIDPYENEYVPAELLGNKCITESINEDEALPDELDDDPDAVMTLDPDGLPTQYDNTPLELDPFAVRLFRNNGDLIDPPEVFDVVKNAADSTEPEIDPGVAQPAEVNTAAADDFIDVVANAKPEEVPEPDLNTVVVDTPPAEKDTAVVELPADDFDVFANESRVAPAPDSDFDVFGTDQKVSHVVPKSSSVLPPQFESVERREQDLDNIAVDPGKNLKFLSYLFDSDDDKGLF